MAKSKKLRSRERESTFEGKNIHFSPLDNKPLCSFSNKLCRQRRLNGFAFCIRHILEDKSSPFKQCDYVTRNNSQRCLNAIPSNQERGYCHSHMQVAGIIPKTERKVKPVPGSSPSSSTKESDSKKENKKKASIRNDNNQVSCGSSSTSTAGTSNAKKSLLPSKTNGKSIPPLTPDSTKVILKNQSVIQTETLSAVSIETSSLLGLQKNGKLIVQNEKNGQIVKKTPNSTHKSKIPSTVGTQIKQEMVFNSPTISEAGVQKLDLQFDQLKTLKISDLSKAAPLFDAKLVKTEPPLLDIPMDGLKEYDLIPPILQFHKKTMNLDGIPEPKKPINGKQNETRQEFLSRVRSAFKSHCKMFRRAYKQSESHEDSSKSFRESLLSCVLANPRVSARMLSIPPIENNCKVEDKSWGRNGDKDNHSASTNFQSNNIAVSMPINKATTTHLNGDINFISSNFLKDFDENLTNERDSSPWMNGGMNDFALGNGKKGKHFNKQYQHLPQTCGMDGKISTLLSKRNQRNAATACSSSTDLDNDYSSIENSKMRNLNHPNGMSLQSLDNETEICSHFLKKRRVDLTNEFDDFEHNLGLDLEGVPGNSSHLLCPSHYSSVAHFETVLNSVSSSDTGTPDGVITDASFDSPFDHSTSSQPDCDFSDDVDLEKTFELQIDPEIAHQASRLLENNELTEDDFNELFPETRSLTDHKLTGDLGIDFTTTFDADIDYSLFANIFPNFRSNNSSEVISVTQNF